VEAIVAQRLVRTICTQCKVSYDPSAELLMELGLRPEDIKGKRFAYGRGCPACHGSGFKGRRAIFEIMVMTETLRQMVLDGASSDTLREAARREGMRSLREAGLLAIFDGVTTVEEVLRETMST
jgi:type IV pilus assembly protein PilB